MPPRMVKKGPGPGRRAAAKASKVAAKTPQNQPDATEEAVKVEEVLKKEAKVGKAVEIEPDEKLAGNDAAGNGSVTVEEVAKDVFEEEDKGERLELEDNEPEYEPEEEAAIDYDEKIDDDGQEVDEVEDDVEEEVEEGDVVEEEDDMVDEDIDDAGEEEEDEDDANGGEHDNVVEHEVDADEAEHHEVVKERRKRKEFEVFVGGLDKDATEDDLRKVFSEIGEINEIRLLMNPQTKKNKGFAFLRFATVEQAKRAVTELKHPIVNGKQCGCAPSQDNDTLFLGNISKTWTKEHLKEKLKSYGIDNIEDLVLVEDTNNEGMNRGFAFLEFSSRSEAMDAYRRLQKRDVVFGVDRTAKVAFADSFIEPDDEIMSQVKTVFVDGVSPTWDEERVKEHVKKFGKIEKIELARNMPAAKRKDFGFITFDTHEAALACAEGINNVELGEADGKVKVRARLSRPLQRGRGKRGTRGDYRISRTTTRELRASFSRVPPRRLPIRAPRGSIVRSAPAGRVPKRLVGYRDRRPVPAIPERPRRLPPPERSYDRRPSIPVYPKSSSKRDYVKHVEVAPRSRAVAEYGPRIPTVRRTTYGDDYSPRRGDYSDIPPRNFPRSAERRPYIDDGYERKVERPVPPYREGRGREYDSISGSKRPYSALVFKICCYSSCIVH
ncbi:Polyadenylate-binding protein 2 [Apostasia shenzhenica]|uniref:Polyadenylate-binding protein 2 n=1 Tax=Apostasia shenzhenica TaxID=1088818 RepID=A0A2I0AYX2_9ASPA|nr:Polyadenylate-binding protein 2 [Apostasia shenzhenica]